MQIQYRRRGGHFEAVFGRLIGSWQYKWMKGIKGSPQSPHLPPTYKNSQRNQMIAAAIPWLGGEGNQQPKRQIEESFSGSACSAQPGAWTQVTTSKHRYGITLNWVIRASNSITSLGKSRGAPLCQCCCYPANFVSFKSHACAVAKLAKKHGPINWMTVKAWGQLSAKHPPTWCTHQTPVNHGQGNLTAYPPSWGYWFLPIVHLSSVI